MLPLQQQIKGMSYSGSLNKMQLLLELNPIFSFITEVLKFKFPFDVSTLVKTETSISVNTFGVIRSFGETTLPFNS